MHAASQRSQSRAAFPRAITRSRLSLSCCLPTHTLESLTHTIDRGVVARTSMRLFDDPIKSSPWKRIYRIDALFYP
ncbi:hypothetical protein DM02DRAFT_207120 [Periconia macrospinosa]|uniref:Uncharacterized protein n=1 Tax=Periconia macrospinosa TaxID=97972 RepID=A0A2V1D7G1_9PLEO|nr:hypothetical protein DM02DRAFT_207120 [Periconia macrospinosa]